jgi:hypothetical protein
MKQPIVYSNGPIYSRGVYDVFIGALNEDALALYFIQNRDTKVIEYSTEVSIQYRGWLDHIEKTEAAFNESQDSPLEVSGKPQLDLDLSKVTKN